MDRWRPLRHHRCFLPVFHVEVESEQKFSEITFGEAPLSPVPAKKPHTERVRAAALSRRETLTWVSPCSGRGQRSRRCRFRADDAEQEVI